MSAPLTTQNLNEHNIHINPNNQIIDDDNRSLGGGSTNSSISVGSDRINKLVNLQQTATNQSIGEGDDIETLSKMPPPDTHGEKTARDQQKTLQELQRMMQQEQVDAQIDDLLKNHHLTRESKEMAQAVNNYNRLSEMGTAMERAFQEAAKGALRGIV